GGEAAAAGHQRRILEARNRAADEGHADLAMKRHTNSVCSLPHPGRACARPGAGSFGGGLGRGVVVVSRVRPTTTTPTPNPSPQGGGEQTEFVLALYIHITRSIPQRRADALRRRREFVDRNMERRKRVVDGVDDGGGWADGAAFAEALGLGDGGFRQRFEVM